MKIYYKFGIHIVDDENKLHILCDPAATRSNSESQDPPLENKDEIVKEAYKDVNYIFVSHAHGDHIDMIHLFHNTNIPVYTHEMSVTLRPNSFTLTNFKFIKENQTILIEHNDNFKIKVEALTSGHCGGSLMFLFTINEQTILFTGDINSEKTYTSNRPIPIVCDVLIMEATFGKPEHTFPERSLVYTQIDEFLKKYIKDEKKSVILFGQGLGKLQDIVKFLNVLNYSDIYLDQYAYKMTAIYGTFYKPVGKYQKLYERLIIPTPSILTLTINSGYSTKDVQNILETYGLPFDTPIAYLSGWSNSQNNSENTENLHEVNREFNEIVSYFPNVSFYAISAHSGYSDLRYFADACQSQAVCLFHGCSAEFADDLNQGDYIAYDLHKQIYEF